MKSIWGEKVPSFFSREVQGIYESVTSTFCLKRIDFESDAEFDDYLQNRSELIARLCASKNREVDRRELEKAKAVLQEQHKDYALRQFELQNAVRKKRFRVIPMLTEMSIMTQKMSETMQARSSRSISYENSTYLEAVRKRVSEWKPNMEVSPQGVGGLDPSIWFSKGRVELSCTLTLPERVANARKLSAE